MTTAIYTRQSVEKRDSLSLDAQLKTCASYCDAKEWRYKQYNDSGFSGKDIKRPAMAQLLQDIKAGKIERVIVYRMDRMSRSVLDFANLLKTFEDNQVSFISTTEQFDTSNPMGRAMVHITMAFAQMERETIRERIRDSWYHRAKQGIFTGGKPPYGYKSVRKLIDGKMQSVLESKENESKIIELIFNLYVLENYSLNAIARELNSKNIKAPRATRWASRTISLILRNVIYCPSNPALYQYFDNQGIIIINDIQDFTGQYGLFHGGKLSGSGEYAKNNKVEEQFLIVGRHVPLVSVNIWLAVQNKLSKNTNNRRTGTGNVTWLGGLIRCKECNYTMEVRKNSAGTYYLRCSGRGIRGLDSCENTKYHKLSDIEVLIEKELKQQVNTYDRSAPVEVPPSNIDTEISLVEISKKIENITNAISEGGLIPSLLKKLQALEDEKKQLVDKLVPPAASIDISLKAALDSFINNWDVSDVQGKSRIIQSIISNISFDKDSNIYIKYKQ